MAILFYILSVLSPSKVIHQVYAVMVLILIVLVNRYFLYLYKTIPYRIEQKDNSLIASQFVLSKKVVTVKLSDITDLKGGIFDARYGSLIRIYTGGSHAAFAFFLKIDNSRELQDYLLKNINKKLYNDIMLRLGIHKEKKNAG
ncbi:MAG: hypothetical protein HYV28_10895 [Ignavibacteriales bacterium]|nr:hypothetical protein [Ignavibacteriales bacterium]